MNAVGRIVTESLLIIAVALTMSTVEAQHWPDFSCLSHKETVRQHNYFIYNRMAWNSCKESHAKDKQECDKMCALRKGRVVVRSKKNGPFIFNIEAFITFMLNELGFENEYRGEAPQGLVNNVTAQLEVCRTNHREFETMTNVRYLPCEPYMGLFACVHNATGCSGDYYTD